VPYTQQPARPYRLGSLYYALYFGVFGLFEPFINPYFQKIGLNGRQIGLLLSIPPLVFLFISPAVAALADRKAWRVRLLTGLLFTGGVLYFIYQFPKTFLPIAIVTVLIALARGPIQPIGDSLILQMAIRHDLDYGQMRQWGSLVYALVAVAAGLVWEWLDISLLFPAAAIGFVLVGLVARGLPESPPVPETARAPWGLILRNPFLLALFISVVLMGATFNLFNFSTLLMAHLGGDERLIGILLGVTALAEVPMMYYASWFMRRLGAMRAMLLCYAIFLIAYTIGTFATAPWMLLIAGGIHGLGFGVAIIAVVVTFDQHAPDNWNASMQSMVSVGIFGFAPFLSSFAFGAIYDIWPSGTYALSLGLIVLASVALFIAMRLEKPL